jgi:hypothetical protein
MADVSLIIEVDDNGDVARITDGLDDLATQAKTTDTSLSGVGHQIGPTGGIRKNTNRFNANIQNLGHQIGDFFVQIQSGQDVLVAFSQQGAQAAGILPGLGGAIIGVSLVVGTSLVRAFTEGTELFRSFNDLIEDAQESVEGYSSALKGAVDALESDLGPEVIEFAKIRLQKELVEATDSADVAVKKSTKSFRSYANELKRLKGQESDLVGQLEISTSAAYAMQEGAEERLDALREEIEALEAAMAFVGTVEVTNLADQEQVRQLISDINKLTGDYREELGLSSKKVDELLEVNEELTGILKLLVENEEAAAMARKLSAEASEEATKNTRNAVDQAKKLAEESEKAAQAAEKYAKAMQSAINSAYPAPMPNVPGQQFANGGVVNRATSFMMTSGRMGVMGEAGPEAILPLKRGPDGKLGVAMSGGGGQVVIHQSFNFSANGDDSVKRIIASEAPKIAKITERSIINSRQRGGSIRKVFG